MRQKALGWMVGVVLAGLLGGCGGGGGGGGSGGGSASTPAVYDLDSLVTRYAEQKHAYTLTATLHGDSYTLELSVVPGTAATFETFATHTSVQTVELLENGALIGNDTVERYYLVKPYEIMGDIDLTTGYVTMYGAQEALPTSAKIGDSGSFATYVTYYDSSLTTEFGSGDLTWRLTTDGAGNPEFCADEAGNSADGTVSETDCYSFDASGTVTALNVTLLVNGVELQFH